MAETCPTIVELEAYLDVGSEVGIGPHIRSCPQCAKRLAALREDASFLADFNREATAFRSARKGADGAPEFPAPPPGYTIQRVLGRGGQAVVYEAVQESTRRRVAIKVVRLGARDATRRLRRFDREIELVSNLRHPLVVTVFDSGITAAGEPYLVMEYVEGAPIAHDPDATVRATLEQFQRVCDAIRHAHQHGVVHRDIKPSNILVDSQNQPRVLDFGLATTLESRESLTLTKSGEFLGTPIYAAPEQLRSGAAVADVRTDVYALGMILYELLTGAHPFAPHSALADIVTGILEEDPKPPSSITDRVDNELDTIVLKAIAKEPERRYASVDALHADIGHYLAGEPIEAKRDSTWYMLRKAARRHRWAVASGAGLLALLIGFSALMSVLYRQASRTSAELSQALRTRDLDRGRDLGRSDDLVSAEPLLWSEYLRWVHDPPQIGDWADGPLLERRAYWALWELYQRQPCFASVRLGKERMRLLTVESSQSIVATSNAAHVVRWNPHTGEQTTLFAPPGIEGPFDNIQTRIKADPRVVFVARGPDAYCWNLDGGQLRSHWRLPEFKHLRGWSNIAQLPWGLAIAIGREDGQIAIWDMDDGSLRQTIGSGIDTPSTIILEDSGRAWVAMSRDAHFAMIDLDSGTVTKSRETVWAGRMSLASDGRLIHSWKIWSGADERLLTSLEETAMSRGNSWRFGASGKLVVGAGTTTPIWRADTGRLVRVLASHDAMVCALGPDDRTLATAHADGSVRAWDISAGAGWRTIAISDTAHCVRFDQTGRRFVIAGCGPHREPLLQLLDTANCTVLAEPTHQVHRITVSSAAFLPGGKFLVTGGHGGELVEWRIDDRALVPVHQATLSEPVNSLAVSPDGESVAVACNDCRVWLWKPGDDSLRSLEGHARRVAAIASSSDGTRLVSGSNDMTVLRWDFADDAKPTLLAAHNGPVRAVCFGAHDRLVVTAGDDQIIQVHDVRDGRLLRRLSGHGVRIFAVAVSPDGTLLASGDASGGIILWDLASGTQLASLTPHGDMVFSLDFSPAGDKLLSGAADGTVRLWDLRYYDRYIAGNFAYQRAKRDDSDGP